MIHVLDYNGQIIDFISRDDNNVISAIYKRDTDNDTLDITVLSARAEHFKKRNRVLIQDQNEVYREYIIEHVEEEGGYLEVECVASYLLDIATSKPIPPGKYEKMTINQKLLNTLRDSGWIVGDCDYAGVKTDSWESVCTPLEMIKQLEITHEVKADYEIVIDGYEVIERRVNMRKPNPLFKGKEIVYGKDLLDMKRTVDYSEVKTALYVLGPEKEGNARIETVVVDDEAQEQFNLPYRYIWGIYEPQTSDEDATLKQLTESAREELDKLKSATLSYEISVVDLEKEFPHETIRFGDIVRIKNPDFTPALYAESEVIGVEYDLISDDCMYEFGKVVEFKEDDLFKYFRSKLNYINQKLNDGFTNVNTIIKDTLDNELQYFEQKILKGTTPPDNPVNDLLWLDTSNPNVAVLRRYWNGEWLNATAENAGDIGAITREEALYSELNNTFVNLSIQHSKLMREVSDVLGSEYLVDSELYNDVQARFDDIVVIFEQIKRNLESMTAETATIGKLIDTQALFLEYRKRMQNLYNAIENAKIAIDKRFRLLQSQYTDEKFNDAMNRVAEGIGGTWNEETGQLIAKIPDQKQIEDALKEYVKGNNQTLHELLSKETDSKIKTAKDELSSNISEVSNKVDGIQVGGRNLVPTNYNYYDTTGLYGYIKVSDDDTQKVVKITEIDPSVDMTGVYFGFSKTGKDATEGIRWEHSAGSLIRDFDNDIKLKEYNYFSFFPKDKETLDKIFKRYKIKVEKGTIATDYTQAPEDFDDKINNIKVGSRNLLLDSLNVRFMPNSAGTGIATQNNDKSWTVTPDKDKVVSLYFYFKYINKNLTSQPLKKNEYYTFSLDVKSDVDTTVELSHVTPVLEQFNSDSGSKFINVTSGQWQRVSFTFKILEDVDNIPIILRGKSTGQLLYYTNVQLESGKYATDWMPAPEDVDKEFNQISTTQTKQSTDIKQLKDNITLKADKSEVTTLYDNKIEPLERQVSNNSSQLTIQANSINSKVSQEMFNANMNNIIGKLSNYESERIQMSHEITDRVTRQEFQDNMYSVINKIDEDVNNLQIGGRNLVRYSTQEYLDIGMIGAYVTGVEVVNGKRAMVFNKSNDIIYLRGSEYSLEEGQTYTFSFYAKASEPLGMTRGVYINGGNAGFIPDTIFGTEWKRYSFTFVAKNSNPLGIHMYPKINNGDGTYKTFYVTDWQLEKGNKATDVTPAIEDIQDKINRSKEEATNASKAYTDAQDKLKETELKAYADGKVTEEEKRAISDAKAKLESAKAYSELKQQEAMKAIDNIQVGGRNLFEGSANAKKALNESTNNYNQYWSTLITNAHSKLKLGDIITISFDVQMERGDVLRVYDNLTNFDFMFGEKIFTNIGNKKQRISFTLPLIPTNKTGSLWNLSFYNNNNGDRFTIENIKIEKGNKPTDYTVAPEDIDSKIEKNREEVEKTLTVHDSRITQNGSDISARATKEEFNASRKTLSKVIADLAINTTTGITLSYDENGSIQSSTIGPDGIKIDATKIDINNGDVTIKNGVTTIKDAYIDKLFSKKATINYLNSVDITAKRLQAVDNRATVSVEGGSITMNRIDGTKLDLSIDGIAMYNSGGSKRFSIDSTLVTSAALGTSNANVYLGTGNNYEARVVDIEGLPSDGYVDSYKYRPLRAEGFYGRYWNINTAKSMGEPIHLYARPLSGGELRITLNEQTTNYQNLRADGIFGNYVNVNGLHGESRHLYLRPLSNGEVRVTLSETTDNFAPIRTQHVFLEGGQIGDNSNGNSYLGTNGEWRFTSNQFYNGGNPSYRDIRFKNWTAMSSEKYKYDISEWEYSVLDAFKNDLKLYKYKNLSEQNDDYVRYHHGVVIEREMPIEWRNGDGFDGNEVMFWNTKAIQELIHKVDELEKKVVELTNEQTSGLE